MKTADEIRPVIVSAVEKVFRDSARPVPPTADDSVFGEQIKLDSLDFAVIVVQLEQQLGIDPFRSGARPVRTMGEFVQLYVDSQAS